MPEDRLTDKKKAITHIGFPVSFHKTHLIPPFIVVVIQPRIEIAFLFCGIYYITRISSTIIFDGEFIILVAVAILWTVIIHVFRISR